MLGAVLISELIDDSWSFTEGLFRGRGDDIKVNAGAGTEKDGIVSDIGTVSGFGAAGSVEVPAKVLSFISISFGLMLEFASAARDGFEASLVGGGAATFLPPLPVCGNRLLSTRMSCDFCVCVLSEVGFG